MDSSLEEGPDEDFFDMIMKAQGGRMDDQRCELPRPGIKRSNSRPGASVKQKPSTKESTSQSNATDSSLLPPGEMKPSVSTENLFDMLQRVQGDRIDEQRFSMPPLPGLDPAGKLGRQIFGVISLSAIYIFIHTVIANVQEVLSE